MTEQAATRRFRSHGVDVEIRESAERSELTLDGHPVDVEVIDGEYHSQLANMFEAFASMEELVDTLLANEGRTWTLRGGTVKKPGHGHDHG